MEASPVQQDQFHQLYDYSMLFARKRLEAVGGFFPFGAVIRSDGKLAAVGAAGDGSEQPPMLLVAQQLAISFKNWAASGSIFASAIVVNVNIPPHLAAAYPDGVRIHLEAPGIARLIYVPYKLSVPPPGAGDVTFAAPVSTELKPQIVVSTVQ